MNLEFPYQLVAFLDAEPSIGEPVYYGARGWYPQIALKRRFKTNDTEDQLLEKLTEYCKNTTSFTIHTKELAQPDRMPVSVLEVEITPELMNFHNEFIKIFTPAIVSRYPEREGGNYLPHITAEYNGELVIDHEKYSNRTFRIRKVYLLKDMTDENSVAYANFTLK